MSKNINLQNIIVSIPNKTLIHNSNLVLTYGSKYGLIGHNGAGKTTLLKYIYKKELGIPHDFSVFYVGQEEETIDSNKTVYQVVLEANKEKLDLVLRLHDLEILLDATDNAQLLDEYNKINEKLDQLQYHKDESIIRKILYGLGFERLHQDALYCDQSGGYKMRASLAKGLYMNPTLLILDEANNHLDLHAMIYITEYLKNKWKNTLLLVSHDVNFLNEVCTHIIHLENKELKYHIGNYDNFLITNKQELVTKEKEWTVIEKKIKEMHRKNIKKEIVDEFIENNKDKQPLKPYKVNIKFNQTSEIKNPLIELSKISFGYTQEKLLFEQLNFSLSNGDKYVLVGKNGVGKSTFLKLVANKLVPLNSNAEIYHNSKLKVSYYDQEFEHIEKHKHLSAVEYIQLFDKTLNDFQARKQLGTIGLDSEHHLKPMKLLSGGQKARVQLVAICVNRPHVLLLDEPTNNLDIESIDSLINGIKEFDGAMIIITHNIALVQQTDCKTLLLDNKQIIELDYDDYYQQILDDVDNFS